VSVLGDVLRLVRNMLVFVIVACALLAAVEIWLT
jgi:hypothetical protein